MGRMGASSTERETSWISTLHWKGRSGEGQEAAQVSEVKKTVPALSQKGKNLVWGRSWEGEERLGFSQRDREGRNLETGK